MVITEKRFGSRGLLLKTFATAALALLVSCARPALLDISTGWKAYLIDVTRYDYRTAGVPWTDGDEKCLKGELPETEWRMVPSLPAALTLKKSKQLCWLRREVVIPESLRNENLSIYLGKLWDCETTYLNGVKIGSSGREYPRFHSDWNASASHFLPNQLIRYGQTNTILIRQFSDQQLNFNGAPFIGEDFRVRAYTFWMRFIAEYLVMALSVMTLLIGLAMLILYFSGNKKDRVTLHFGGISIVWFVLTTHFWLPDFSPLSWRLQDNLFYVLVAVIVVWIYHGIEVVLNFRIRWARVIAWILFSLQVIMAATATIDDPITNWRFSVMGPLGLLVQMLWGYVIAKGIRAKNPEAKILLIGYVVFVLTLLHDALMMNRVIMSYAFLSNIAYPCFIMSFAIVILRRVSILNEELMQSSAEITTKNARLQRLVESVIESTDELIGISITVKDTSDTLNAEMETQSSSLTQTSATLEEFSGSISAIAEHTRDQDLLVKESETALNEYIESLNSITEAAQYAAWLGSKSKEQSGSITDKLTSVSAGMQKIKESSSSIEDIADMINDIAEKTNLLSLNAAIEAARAGEHGRGFAVVAEEIGKLADSSVAQAKTIQKIIQQVVSDIEHESALVIESSGSVQEINRASEDVNSAVAVILKLCDAQNGLTRNIREHMKNISMGSSEITGATREQQVAMQEVMNTILSLNHVVEQVNQSVLEMAAISGRLSHRIAFLNRIIIEHEA